MSNVVELLPNNALCVDQPALAERLHAIADRIGAGEMGGVDTVCIVMSAPEGGSYRVYGRPVDNAGLIGMLEYTKARIMGVIE